MVEREWQRLEEVLDGYSSSALNALTRAWFSNIRTSNRMNKQERCEYIARCLTDPVTVAEQVETLHVHCRELLALSVQSREELTVGGLVFAAQERGMRDAATFVRRLLDTGLLLVRRMEYENRIELAGIERRASRVLFLPAKPQGLPELGEPPTEFLPTVAKGRVGHVVGGEPARLVGALVNVTALAARSKIKLTKAGHVAAGQLSRLQRESGVDEKILPISFLLDIALAADLLRPTDEGALRPTRSAAMLLSVPLSETLTKILDGMLLNSAWPDDLPWSDPAALSELLREPPDDFPVADARRLARRVVASLLRRLDATGWVDIDEFVSIALEICPALLCWPRDGGYRRYFGSGDDFSGTADPYEQAVQWEYVRCCVARTCLAFGLVEVAPTGRAAPYEPCRPTRDYAYWSRFRDPQGRRTRFHEQSEKSPWTPTPCRMAFRITDLGRQVLRGEKPVGLKEGMASLHVGPDFEIVAPRAEVPQEVLLRLDAFATPLDSHPSDPVRRYRLEKASLIRALRTGMQMQDLRTELETHSGRPLPANVSRTLDDWASSFGSLELFLDRDLVEVDGAAEVAALLKTEPEAVQVGKRLVLVPRCEMPTASLIDYSRPPTACVSVKPSGQIIVDRRVSDLLVENQIAGYADSRSRKGAYVLSRESVSRSAWRPDEILEHLHLYGKAAVPKGVAVAINGWKGAIAPVPAQDITVIRISDPLVVAGLLARDDLRSRLVGEVAPGLLVVKDGKMQKLRGMLRDLGIDIDDGHNAVAPAA